MNKERRLAELRQDLRTEASGRTVVGVDDAASLIGVSPQTIRRRIWDGTLPAARLGGRRGPLRIRVSDLARLLVDAEACAVPIAPESVMRRAARTDADDAFGEGGAA